MAVWDACKSQAERANYCNGCDVWYRASATAQSVALDDRSYCLLPEMNTLFLFVTEATLLRSVT